jgi:hypothetical protein
MQENGVHGRLRKLLHIFENLEVPQQELYWAYTQKILGKALNSHLCLSLRLQKQ